MDIFVVNQGGTPHLFKNVTPRGKNHWLEVDVRGTRSNRDGIGTRLVLTTKSGSMLRLITCGSTSVASGSQKAALFGLGPDKIATKLTVTWPSGTKQVLKNVRADRFMTLVEPR